MTSCKHMATSLEIRIDDVIFLDFSLLKCELHNEGLGVLQGGGGQNGAQKVRKAAAGEGSSYLNTPVYLHRNSDVIRAASSSGALGGTLPSRNDI